MTHVPSAVVGSGIVDICLDRSSSLEQPNKNVMTELNMQGVRFTPENKYNLFATL